MPEKQKKERKKTKGEQDSHDSDFKKTLQELLEKKELEVTTVMLEKKKEFWAIVRAGSVFGKQEYYVIAKDKRKITEQEIDQALERSQSEKMPVVIIAP